MMLTLKTSLLLLVCISSISGDNSREKRQINFGGGGNSRPSKRPSSSNGVSFGSSSGGQSPNRQTSLKDLLGEKAPSTNINTRFNFRRQGSQCRTPLGEAGTCQYIFSQQCGSILNIILQQGINQQVLAYLFQAIRSPCGFQGFDFTLCCADPNQPLVSSPATSAPTNPTPAPTPATTTTTQPPPQDSCGINARNNQDKNRIVGGVEAAQGAWPWAVILGRSRFGGGFQVMCGGTLLNEDTILTAAHCFDSVQQGPNKVRLGDHDITTNNDGAIAVDISIARSIQHPGWNSNTLSDDIAIVKLSSPVSYTRNIRRACLPDAYIGKDLASLLANDPPTIIGWGSTSTGGGPQNRLRQARVPMVTQQTCINAYAAISRVTIGSTKICAGDGRRDTCNGDSGGALLSKTIGGSYAVVGITSFGVDCARPDFPGVYTRVDQYLAWIRQHM